MYRITNTAGDSATRLKRKVAPGRKSRTRLYHFQGRRILPKRTLTITDQVYEGQKALLLADEKIGIIKVERLPNGLVGKVIEAKEKLPLVEEVVTETTPVDTDPPEPTEEELAAGQAEVAELHGDEEAEDLTAEAVEGDEDDPEDLTTEALPSEAVEGLKDKVETKPEIPHDAVLKGMTWGDLQKLARSLDVQGRKKADILTELAALREEA